MITLSKTLETLTKKLCIMEGFGARAAHISKDSMSNRESYSYLIQDGGDPSASISTKNGFTPAEVEEIAQELDAALRKILSPRITKTLEDIRTMATPL